jgi:hypothetical protein
LGSGAIESAIRRVINLRLKGSGLLWLEENAEAVLVLRAAVLTDRWQETLEHVREAMASDRRLDWHWQSPDMPAELKAGPHGLVQTRVTLCDTKQVATPATNC